MNAPSNSAHDLAHESDFGSARTLAADVGRAVKPQISRWLLPYFVTRLRPLHQRSEPRFGSVLAEVHRVWSRIIDTVAATWNDTAVHALEVQLAIRAATDSITAFVHQPMMTRTKKDRVTDARLAPVDPVNEMMRMDPAGFAAPRKNAATISGPQCAPNRCRNSPLLSADIQRPSRGILGHDDETPIARQTLDHLYRQFRPRRPSAEGCMRSRNVLASGFMFGRSGTATPP